VVACEATSGGIETPDADLGEVEEAPSPRAPRAGTKISEVIERLGREAGATIDEIVAATGWLSPTRAATARKLAVIIWHLLRKGESYAWARPALHAKKLRDLELKAGYKAERGQRGAAHVYNVKSHRDQERRWVEQAETAYARFVTGWSPRGPKRARTGAANEGRQ
jgi:hypothetical protein